MNAALQIHRTGPGLSVQDLGRPGYLAEGLSRGGGADRLALLEATALLGLPRVAPAIEMAGTGGEFAVTTPMRIALTGAPMQASIDGTPLRWHAAYLLTPGQVLRIGGARSGVYGYLTPAGGIDTPEWLGSRAAHLTAGIGALLQAGDALPLGQDPDIAAPPMGLPPPDRFAGGTLRLRPGPQTALFDDDTLARFLATPFTRNPAGNRQGVRLDHDGTRFTSALAAGLASDMIRHGDVQMTGDGTPYVLLSECQTIGGYPRLATVIDADLPRIAQAPPGAALRFEMLTTEAADAQWRDDPALLADLRRAVHPLVRDPHDIADLLSYQLISGATAGDDLERD